MVLRGQDGAPEPDEPAEPGATEPGGVAEPGGATGSPAEGSGDDAAGGRAGAEVVNRYPGTGVSALLIGIFAVLVLAIIFLAQNTDSVPIAFLAFDAEAPLFVILLATLVASSIATLLLAELWRSRRRRQRAEREELERLRRGRAS